MFNSIQVPLLLSRAHLHPTKALINQLFGDLAPTVKRELTLRGNWVFHERVLVSREPGGRSISVALLGPWRREAQLELNPSQARALKLDCPWRQSGALDGSPGFYVAGPAGGSYVPRGAILAEKHIHAPAAWSRHLRTLPIFVEGSNGRRMYYDVPVKRGIWDKPEIHWDYEVGESLFGGQTVAVVTIPQRQLYDVGDSHVMPWRAVGMAA
jgi:propanediol utilization protein